MRVIRDVVAAFQGAAGSQNQNFYTGQALGVRIVPNATGNLGNLWPRSVIVEDSQKNQIIDLSDSSWFVIQRNIINSAYFGNIDEIRQSTDNPLAHTVGPSVKLRFGVDQVGASLNDTWDVYIAEDLVDVLTPIEPSGISFVRDATSGLFFPISGTGNQSGVINVGVTGSVNIANNDGQAFDGTATAATLLTSGSLGSAAFRDALIRISGFTPPTTRSVTINAIRSDASTVPLLVFTPGATITDTVISFGQGAAVPATPTGATSEPHSLGCPLPINWNVVISAGADTPRMTIWERQNS